METESSGPVRVLAVIVVDKQETVRRQMLSFGMVPVLLSRASELASHIRAEESYQVVLLPASLPNTDDWWSIWGELALLNPRPAILVYAPTASFQLWSGVLDAGGYDVIVEPLTDAKLKDALLRAAESYRSSESFDQDA